ncbi:MAG TPA: hypothetical protein VG448_11660 [Solirubrobacterales bacterium]|nr:hypothetical protein [Solirubrobacterales bacterium]
MGWARAVLALVAVVAAGALLLSGGSRADPRTPSGLPSEPPPFLGTAVVGSGGLTAAIDAYGDVVDLRVPGPAGESLIGLSAAEQAAGTVPADTGIVPWVRVGKGAWRPLWSAASVAQSYRPRSNVLVITARFGKSHVRIVYGAGDSLLVCLTQSSRSMRVDFHADAPAATQRLRCNDRAAQRTIGAAAHADRRWLAQARPLAADAPAWARQMYERSLLVLHALTDRRVGAVAAGARDSWAYVWPRDAATAALAFDAAGYRTGARRIVHFLLGLDLKSAARFYGNGEPVPGRGPQGDAAGWVGAAARRVGLPAPPRLPWRNLPDYQEGESGDYLANAIAASADGTKLPLYGGKSSRRLVRRLGDPSSGRDSAAAWAVEPFRLRPLFPTARESMLRLARRGGRFGITPSEDWKGGRDPWSAPTAWTAWSLAALAREDAGSRQASEGRRLALRLLDDLRRSATPAGALPERVDYRTGLPTSTTPLAWSHAFAILALRELWPPPTG